MRHNKRIVAGPVSIGNIFGFFKEDLLPTGKFAIVEDGEYANGGYGPSTIDGRFYDSYESAHKELDNATH